MALEMGLWRADGKGLTRLAPSGVGLESQLEDYIESDPALLGQRLLLIGRQVPTAHGGFIDLLAVDGDGIVHVL
jgi:RecB family endonuclease NucS